MASGIRSKFRAVKDQRGGDSSSSTLYQHGWSGGAQGLYHYTVKRIESTPMFNPFGGKGKQVLGTPTAGVIPPGIYYMRGSAVPSKAAVYPPSAPPTISHRAMATGDPKAMGYISAASYAAAADLSAPLPIGASFYDEY